MIFPHETPYETSYETPYTPIKRNWNKRLPTKCVQVVDELYNTRGYSYTLLVPTPSRFAASLQLVRFSSQPRMAAIAKTN